MPVPNSPRPRLVAESDLPNEHWATNALVELKQALLAFPLWPSVLLHCDNSIAGYPTRGAWMERALAAHLRTWQAQGYHVEDAWEKRGDFDITATLRIDDSHGILAIIETDNTRKDQVGLKYLRSLEGMDEVLADFHKSHPGVDFLFVYISFCYPGDSNYPLTHPVNLMKAIARRMGLPFVFWGFIPEAAGGHARFHPTAKNGESVHVHTFAGNHPIAPVRTRSLNAFTNQAQLIPNHGEDCQLLVDLQHLNIPQIKGLLYFPRQHHDLMLDWNRLRPYLDKGK